ncbi:TadE/TadG family type IV pilus assembly protein [Rhizobium herbae]|uniref:Flp pilus assembly protein TadG n=1 Tax=Rhizobium herbae TaxID=508661 RepID=A0ABS4EIY4_9HYPH|nr:TadE/TadG family type IV pilus assembly protein [Rhizobium herbae]MBP1857910.1 Flp pilus assembly protein TadG [Rhizobium herbae]
MLKKRNVTSEVSVAGNSANRRGNSFLRRLARDRTGASALEFAILVPVFLMALFPPFETFTAFIGEQLFVNATDTMARKVRTGEAAHWSEEEFRKAFCAEISLLMTCSDTEAKTASRLFIDVRSFADFANIRAGIPRQGTSAGSDLDTTGFKFAPGGPQTVNVVRAYYRWPVAVDYYRAYTTNLRPAGSSMPSDYLMAATAVFRSEKY